MRIPIAITVILAMGMPPRVLGNEEPLSCELVAGVLSAWNGWPPHFRLETPDGAVYGVPEAEDGEQLVPDDLVDLLAEKTSVAGRFTLCRLGKTTSVPYDTRPIALVSILDYEADSK